MKEEIEKVNIKLEHIYQKLAMLDLKITGLHLELSKSNWWKRQWNKFVKIFK